MNQLSEVTSVIKQDIMGTIVNSAKSLSESTLFVYFIHPFRYVLTIYKTYKNNNASFDVIMLVRLSVFGTLLVS